MEMLLFSLHQMAASFIPEAEIDKEESKVLAESLAGVSEFYGKAIDPKVMAWFALGAAAAKVYGPRVAAFSLRKKMEKEAKAKNPKAGKPAEPFSVVPFNTPQNG